MGVGRAASGYYAANALLLASYAAVRLWSRASWADGAVRRGSITSPEQLESWERQVLMALGAVTAFKLWKRRSWDDAAAQIFFWAKAMLAVVAYMLDPRLMAWYCLAYWAVFALLPQPIMDLDATDSVTTFTPALLREASVATDCATMVFFYSQTHGPSIAAAPAFVAAADEFASSKLRFGAFDVSVWPRAAAELRVSSNTWTNQLPAVVLYEKGKEYARIPSIDSAVDPRRRNAYGRADIVRLFRLEERFSRPLGDGAAAAGKSQ